MSHQHLEDAISHSQEFPIEMYGREPTFESLAKPTPKRICSGGIKKIEEWLLLSSKYAVVCSYGKSHHHIDAKIVKNFHRNVWEGTYF